MVFKLNSWVKYSPAATPFCVKPTVVKTAVEATGSRIHPPATKTAAPTNGHAI